ncbi:MAG: hypothetical protein ACRC46_09320 [Thermoguttaceae bacterium]
MSTPHVVHQGFIPYLFECVFGRWTPRAILWGVVIGTVLGFVPKANLTAVVLVLVLYFTPANVLAGLAAAVVAWVASLSTATIAAEIGGGVTRTFADVIGVASNAVPLVAWLDLDSPLLMGQLIIGVVTAAIILLVARTIITGRTERDATTGA